VLKGTTDDERKDQLMNEAYFLLMLSHPHIPSAYGLYDVKILGEPGLGMILDYKPGFDLSGWIPVGGFPEWAIKGLFAQLVDVLLYLHRLLIVHRDIKPSNILCERGEDGSMKVCLADFGLAAHVEQNDTVAKRCGSPGFVAPEIFDEGFLEAVTNPQAETEQVMKIDVFSFGMTIYGAALGTNPFISPTLRQTYKNNACAVIPAENTATLSAALQDLMRCVTAKDPRTRWSIFQVASHPWIQADLRELGFAGADEDMHGDRVSYEMFESESHQRQE
jgi:serine/threonine protein kinase